MPAVLVVLGLLGYAAIGRFVTMPLVAWLSGRLGWDYEMWYRRGQARRLKQ